MVDWVADAEVVGLEDNHDASNACRSTTDSRSLDTMRWAILKKTDPTLDHVPPSVASAVHW